MDKETAKLMAEKGIWLSTQPFLDDDGDAGARQLGPAEQAKMKQVIAGTDNVYRLAKNIISKPRSAPTSCFPPPRRSSKVIAYPHSSVGTPAEALAMATSANANCSPFPDSAIRTPASSAS